MGQFAKLFEVGDDQIVVMNTTNDDGDPQVKFIIVIQDNIHVGGPVEMSLGPVFEPKSESNTDFNLACDAAQKYFDSVDFEKAEKILIGMVDQYYDLLADSGIE